MFVRPQPFEEAVSKLGSRTPIAAALSSEEWSRIPLALRERAFFSAQVEEVRWLQDTRDMLTDFLRSHRESVKTPSGNVTEALRIGSKADFVQYAREQAIALGVGPVDPHDKGGLKDPQSQKRLELIFDVQTQAAFSYGDWKASMDPVVLDEFPAWRFIREAEVKKPRAVHAMNEGVVRLKTDIGFWMTMNDPSFGGFGVPWGPWGFHSGMGVEDVDREEAERLGLLQPGEVVQPAEQPFNEKLKASTRGLDPEMIEHLKKSFGNQITITGNEARWNPPTEPAPTPTPVPSPAPSPAPAPQPQPSSPVAGTPPPVSAPAATVPPPDPATAARQSVANILQAIGLGAQPVTQAMAADLRRRLKHNSPAKHSDVTKSIQGASRGVTTRRMKAWVDEFLSYVPPALAQSLPKIEIRAVKAGQLRGALGEYKPSSKTILVRASSPINSAKETLFHELVHWLHIEGPQWYRDAIASHFAARTAGEAIVPLYPYRASGKLDRWYDPYAGAIYARYGPNAGLEVPTRYLQVLAKEDFDLAALMLSPDFMETFAIALQITR